MEIWNETAWGVSVLFNVCMVLIPSLAAVGATLQVCAWVRQAWRNAIRQLVDEPSDPVIQLIAAHTKYTTDQVSRFIVGNLDRVIALLPEEAKPKGG